MTSANSSFHNLRKEPKLLATALFCIAFTQIHNLPFLFPEGNVLSFLGLDIVTKYYGSWQILTGMVLFVGSACLLCLWMIATLPRLYFRYYLPLITVFLVNGAQVINLLMDSRLTITQKLFNPWYTTLPLFLILAFLLRSLLKTSPSEQNRELRAKIDKLRREELVEVWDKLMTIKYSAKAIEKSQNLDSWKRLLWDLCEEGEAQVINAIKAIQHGN